MNQTEVPTACVIVIGNEILSGKTQDANIRYLGQQLAKLGIVLAEARVLRDDAETIVSHVNECRGKYTYVFTTGGIGPTHDDITADAIARAFDTELELNDLAVQKISSRGFALNESRLKMARIPIGATLVENSVSRAPGFRIENVFVFAGIPAIVQAMFDAVRGELLHGPEIYSESIDVFLKESDIAAPLEAIAAANPDVEIGSYPFTRDGAYGANLVVRGTDVARIRAIIAAIVECMPAIEADAPGSS